MTVPAEMWWSRLRTSTRAWLIEHNGETLPAAVVAELESAAGESAAAAWWAGGGVGEVEPSDEFVDWVEAIANGEQPPGPRLCYSTDDDAESGLRSAG